MTFETLAGRVPEETSQEKQVRKTLMASPCPRCVIDEKLRKSKLGIILDEIEFKVYTSLRNRPHRRCSLAGPSMDSVLKAQVYNSF